MIKISYMKCLKCNNVLLRQPLSDKLASYIKCKYCDKSYKNEFFKNVGYNDYVEWKENVVEGKNQM